MEEKNVDELLSEEIAVQIKACCLDNCKSGYYENRAEGSGIAHQKTGKGN